MHPERLDLPTGHVDTAVGTDLERTLAALVPLRLTDTRGRDPRARVALTAPPAAADRPSGSGKRDAGQASRRRIRATPTANTTSVSTAKTR